MNMCTLDDQRANVEKFEPAHGWGSDTRKVDQLTTGELMSLIEFLRQRNARLSTKTIANRCRFNCRTAKENWIEGYLHAARVDDDYALMNSADMLNMAKGDYRDWQRKQETARKGLHGKLGKDIPGDGDGIG